MAWQFNRREAVYLQIADRLRNDILSGKLGSDEQIPSVRQLACEAAVNPNTVQKALTELEKEGLICTRTTVGRFVTHDAEVLKAARQAWYRETVCAWLKEAKAMGLSRESLLAYIQETIHEEEKG